MEYDARGELALLGWELRVGGGASRASVALARCHGTRAEADGDASSAHRGRADGRVLSSDELPPLPRYGGSHCIADGRVDHEVVAGLHAAMVASGTRLVLARAHIWDGLSQVDQETTERVIRAVEAFGSILMVVDGPDVVEPLSEGRSDIVVEPCRNFRELVHAPAAAPWLRRFNDLQDDAHVGDVTSQVLLRDGAPMGQPYSKRAHALFMQGFVSLCSGWLGDDGEVITAFWEAELGVTLKPHERAWVVTQLEAASAVVGSVGGAAAEADIDFMDILRKMAAAGSTPAVYPGQWLAMRVGGERRRNPTRAPLRSDMVDIDHVTHFPYVDVATCDATTYHAVNLSIRSLNGPRTPALVRTGRLDQVVELVRRLMR